MASPNDRREDLVNVSTRHHISAKLTTTVARPRHNTILQRAGRHPAKRADNLAINNHQITIVPQSEIT